MASPRCPLPTPAGRQHQGWGSAVGEVPSVTTHPLCHRATNLRASLPLPEYCGASGRLNLATYVRGQRGRRWLRPRVRVAYGECGTGAAGGTRAPPARAGARRSPPAPVPLPGVRPQHRSFGTKNLTVEAADSISVLAHAAPAARGTGGARGCPHPDPLPPVPL